MPGMRRKSFIFRVAIFKSLEIAVEAIRLNIGARAIKRVVQNMFKDILYQLLVNGDNFTKCIIQKEIIGDSSKYVLE